MSQFPTMILADASPDVIWNWLAFGGKVFGGIVAAIAGLYRLVKWIRQCFASKPDFDALDARVKLLEASQRTVADDAREQKHQQAVNELLDELVKAAQKNHRK